MKETKRIRIRDTQEHYTFKPNSGIFLVLHNFNIQT